MFEINKIDHFFSNEKNPFEEEERFFVTKRMKIVRFLKLFLPCLTAMLLGLGVVLFEFDTTNDSSFLIKEQEKVYFEKFQMNNPVFEVTEKDNRFSIIKANKIEEAFKGKKIYNLTNPDAVMYDKDKVVTLASELGIYNQDKTILELNNNVVGDYNKQMKINTNSATYIFSEERGFGNEKIYGASPKGNFIANSFNYDKKSGKFDLIGNVLLSSDDIKLETPNKATLFFHDNKFEAINPTTTKGKDILKTDLLVAHFKDLKNFEIEKATTFGNTKIYTNNKEASSQNGEYDASTGLIKLFNNVKIIDENGYIATADNGVYDSTNKQFILTDNVEITKGSSKILTPKAIYFQNKEEFFFYDDVKVIQEEGTASAQSGVYYVKRNIAELNGNVVLTKDSNTVKGDKAISNFNTSKSKLIAKSGGRISGKLIESSLNSKKD